MSYPKITEINDPVSAEDYEFVDDYGQSHTFRIVLGRPILFESKRFENWYCPCATAVDGVMLYNRFGGPGHLSSILNACKYLSARRAQVVDAPERRRLGIEDPESPTSKS